MLSALTAIMREVGALLLEWRERGGREGQWVGTQFKAEADRMAHAALVQRLRGHWPDIPVVSEEDESEAATVERYWLIDPIDGTASFAAGYAGFVTQAALIEQGRPEVGVVFAPALDLLYGAQAGAGARLNGETMMRSTAGSETGLALIDNYPQPRGIAAEAYESLGCTRYVESGSIGLKICRVADGTADLFIKDVVVRDWDLAPADLVLAEAGGALSDIAGQAFVYEGRATRQGLIAARDEALRARVARWQALRKS